MEPIIFLDILSRWAHVGATVVLVGGAVFQLFVLIPAASNLSDEDRSLLQDQIASRWQKFIMIGIGLLMLSGFYNFSRAIIIPKAEGMKFPPLYHIVIGIKILIAFVVFFLASALSGKSKALESFRTQQKKWLAITITLAVIVIAMAGYAKVAIQAIAETS